MADIKNWSSLGQLDEEWNETVKAAGGSPDLGAFPNIQAMRDFLENAKKAMAQAMAPPVFTDVKEQDHQVKMRDGQNISPSKQASARTFGRDVSWRWMVHW